MASRKLPLLLLPVLILGLMAVAVLLVVGGDGLGGRGADGDNSAAGVDAAEPARGHERGGVRGPTRRKRPGSISGDVRTLVTRWPAAAKSVVLVRPDHTVVELSTAADGGFSFAKLPPGGPDELRFEGDDHAPVLRPGLWLTPAQRLDVGTLWLADGVRVGVEVLAFDGRPLANAVVRAFTTGAGATPFDSLRDPAPVAAARTGPDGWGQFEGLPPGTWTFTAERAGYARRGLISATVRAGVDEESFQLFLERGHRLEGHVLDLRGNPVRGATVLAIRRTLASDPTTAALAQRTVTDREGRYVFAALPATDVVLWSGWPRGRLAVLAAVRLPGVKEVDLTLVRGGRLVGRISAADDNTPIRGAIVDVTIRVIGSFALRFKARTNDLGNYSVRLPMPGTVDHVSVNVRGYISVQPALGTTGQIIVPSGATVRLDAPLRRGGVIAGQVTGPDGPIEGAEVGATNNNWYFTTTTDRQGRYTLPGLPGERFFLLARKWGHVMPGLPLNPDGALAAGSAPAEFVVELAPGVDATVNIRLEPGNTLSGRVETANGAAAGGALVEVRAGGIATHADDDGSFVLGPVEPGDHTVVATLAGFGAGHAAVTVPAAGAAIGDVVLRLPPGVRVTGRLISATGAALEGAYIQIVPWNGVLDKAGADEWSWLESSRLPVAADGTFDHPLLYTGGRFFVRAGALGRRRASSLAVGIVGGQGTYYFEMSLEEGETFAGQVVNIDGIPVAGAFISAVRVPVGTAPTGVDYPGAWGPPISAVADRNGVFRIDGLDEGAHVFRAWSEGYLPESRALSVPEDSGARFEIAAWMSISGRVLFPDGQPVAGATIGATGGTGNEYTEGRTDDDGRFFITGLSDGQYAISVSGASGGGQEVVATAVRGVDAGATDVRIDAERGFSISGDVTDADGRPVAGASVSAGNFITTTTDARGAYVLHGVAHGTHTVSVRGTENEKNALVTRDGVAAGTSDVRVRFGE